MEIRKVVKRDLVFYFWFWLLLWLIFEQNSSLLYEGSMYGRCFHCVLAATDTTWFVLLLKNVNNSSRNWLACLESWLCNINWYIQLVVVSLVSGYIIEWVGYICCEQNRNRHLLKTIGFTSDLYLRRYFLHNYFLISIFPASVHLLFHILSDSLIANSGNILWKFFKYVTNDGKVKWFVFDEYTLNLDFMPFMSSKLETNCYLYYILR